MNQRDPSDVANGRRLVAVHGADLLFVDEWGGLVYDGTRWLIDKSGEIERRAKAVTDAMLEEAAKESDPDRKKHLAQHALRSRSWRSIRDMIAAAKSESAVVARPEDFDRDPWLLNVANGTIDLRTGGLRPHAREDRITKISTASFDPSAEAPRFRSFVYEIMGRVEENVHFLQRALGYSLTSLTTEQCLFLLCGVGANGKGALLRTVEKALGPYHRKADVQTFLEMRSDRIREDIADLVGARIVSAEEPSKGRQLAEGIVKTMTGGDTISARFLRRDRFTFRPAFKLWLAFNQKPRIRGTDHGIWRRIHLIDFPVIFEPDLSLEPAMEAELSGVLAWLVEGCLAWQREGLHVPQTVRDATANYRAEQDTFGEFLADRCDLDSEAKEGASALYAAYNAWAIEQHIRQPMSQTAFGLELSDRGFSKDRAPKGRVIRQGLRLRLLDAVASSNGNGTYGVNSEQSQTVFPDNSSARARIGGTGELFTTVHTVHSDNVARTEPEALEAGS